MTSKRAPFAAFGLKSDLQYLVQNLGLLLGAGVDVASALESIQEGVRSARMKRIIASMREELAGGASLATVFEHSGLFPIRVASLIRIGEASGRLVEHFSIIGVQEEKQKLLESKIQSALVYPVFVLAVTFIVGIAVSWFILPHLAKVFAQMKLELPLITKIILGFGSFLSSYGLIVVPLFFLFLAAVFFFLFVHAKTRWVGERFLFSLPGIHRLIQEVELTRLGYVLGGLLKSGVFILDAFESLEDATRMAPYRKLYAHMRVRIAEGDSFERSIRSFPGGTDLIPAPVQQLLVTASKSGTMGDVLLRTGAVFEEKTDATGRNLSVVLEPFLLLVVWVAVVCVALGVILPIYSLIGGINHR